MADRKPKIGDNILVTLPGPDDTLEIISQTAISGETENLWYLANGGSLQKADLLAPSTTHVYRYQGVLVDSDLGKSLSARVEALSEVQALRNRVNYLHDALSVGNLELVRSEVGQIRQTLLAVEKVAKPATRSTSKKADKSED